MKSKAFWPLHPQFRFLLGERKSSTLLDDMYHTIRGDSGRPHAGLGLFLISGMSGLNSECKTSTSFVRSTLCKSSQL